MKKDKKELAFVITGSLAGAMLGWMIKDYSSKRLQLEENKPFLQELKQKEKKLYEDGKKKAKELEEIKNTVKAK
jgi:membrane protein YqaA with SNARE-associated domain